jgi:anaerobic selenocysteine-containing dehydrogenase
MDLELLVTIDPVMSATSRLADYVIAPRIQLEVSATTQLVESITHPGYGWDVPYARWVPALVDPPVGSDLIEEWQLFYRLAQRLDLQLELTQSFRSRGGHMELHSPTVTPLDMNTEPATDELYALMCSDAAVPFDEVRSHRRGSVFTEAQRRVAPARAGHAERLDVANDTMLAELSEVRREAVGAHDEPRHPFLLIPRRADGVYNSFGQDLESIRAPSVPNPAFMHAGDLDALGISPGDDVLITSDHGSLRAVVEVDPSGLPGVVSMSHCFGVHAGVATDPRAEGSNTNRLSSLTDIVDEATGQPRMGAIPVSVTP